MSAKVGTGGTSFKYSSETLGRTYEEESYVKETVVLSAEATPDVLHWLSEPFCSTPGRQLHLSEV